MPTLLDARPLGASLRPARREDDYALCGKCGCSFFEEIRLARIDKNQIVIPGQTVPKLSEVFLLLKCGKCNELHEPPLVQSTSHSYKAYVTMLQELDAKPEDKSTDKK
jgi:hypothetical protein